ncbi:MAG: hypothetical protein AB7I37_24405 [Pirellulales bacterium]
MSLLGLVARWLHILSAIAAVGGTIFARVALLPSLSVLGESDRKNLHDAIRGRWSKVVMASIGFLLLSGLYNIGVLEMRKQIPADGKAIYHALFGIKFLLALAIFFIASALVGRSQAFTGIRQNAKFWLSVNLTLAIVLVCVSGALRMIREPKLANPPAVAAQPVAGLPT